MRDALKQIIADADPETRQELFVELVGLFDDAFAPSIDAESPHAFALNVETLRAAPKHPLSKPGDYRLPDGTVIELSDWILGSYYSALELDADHMPGLADASSWTSVVELFGYSRAQDVPCTGRAASALHTNLPRSGYNGLPHGWEAILYDHRFWASERGEVVDAYLATLAARFNYREKTYWEAPLTTLLDKAPRVMTQELADAMFKIGTTAEDIAAFAAARDFLPIRIFENLSFKVVIETSSQTPAAADALADYLREPRALTREQVVALERLDAIRAFCPDAARSAIADAIAKIRGTKSRTLTVWALLDGMLKRPVV